MGANEDFERVYGRNHTFSSVQSMAERTIEERGYSHGHRGYSGTMAESWGNIVHVNQVFVEAMDAEDYIRSMHDKNTTFIAKFDWTTYTGADGGKPYEVGDKLDDYDFGFVYGGRYSY